MVSAALQFAEEKPVLNLMVSHVALAVVQLVSPVSQPRQPLDWQALGLPADAQLAVPQTVHPAMGVYTQPVADAQLSVVHWLPSLHVMGEYWQPLVVSQLSVVQALLSLHELTMDWYWQPLVVSQLSLVQALLSLHVMGAYWQPLTLSQLSLVHALLSLHVMDWYWH